MKPIRLTTDNHRQRDSSDRVVVKRRRLPITDYGYHSGAFKQSSGYHLPVDAPSFRDIGADYFKHEARHDFLSEAVLFGFIAMAAALPLMNTLHALIQFVRAITF